VREGVARAARLWQIDGVPHASTPGVSGGVPDEAWSPRAVVPGAPPTIALPGYRNLVLVASGGDSFVYRAQQEGLNRPVAVKVLVGEQEGVPPARYQRELEITVRLGRAHPNIVTVLDTQTLPDGRPCIVMEYYELGSLQDQLRAHGPLPASAVVAAGTVVADALAYAHREGVLHRDVKPQNILVLPTSYVLADFGLARRIDAGHTASLERFSYRHASPQVLDGELPTVADDVYSLGSTLFTLLDGRTPFAVDDPEADSALAYLRRARSELPRPIRSSDATPELLAIIDRCLAKRREDRFADAATLRDALRSVVTEARVWSRTWQPRTIPGRAGPTFDEPSVPAPPPPAAESSAPAALAQIPTVSASAPLAGIDPLVRHWDADPPRPPAQEASTPRILPRDETPTPRIIAPPPTPAPDPRDAPPLQAGPSVRIVPGPVTAAQPAVDLRSYPGPGRVGQQRLPRPQWNEEEYDDSVGLDGENYDADRPGRGPWRRLLLLALLALVFGTALGVGGSWLRARLRPDATSPYGPVQTFTGTLPTGAGTQRIDPTLAPQVTTLTDRGTSVVLVWTDPSGGAATFLVLSVDGANTKLLLQVSPGTTTATVTGLDSAAPRYCFEVVAFVADAAGSSELACTPQR
jgi:serine/threonine protein kinase